MKKFAIPILLALFASACDSCNNYSPTSPSAHNEGGTSLPNLWAWKPCVIVQTPGDRNSKEFQIQMNAVQDLQQAGKLKWIRLGHIGLNREGKDYAVKVKSMGLNVFGIITLEQLESDQSWENVFDRFYYAFPEVDIWEIAGEISNPDPHVNTITMTPDEYMPKFKKLYTHVKKNYPGAVLTNAPPYGTGSSGSQELERFFELGLLDMDVIVAMNIYSDHALTRYAAVLGKYAYRLAGKRIWVTETGAHSLKQLAHVSDFYPKLANVTNAEMICWYVMWGGDTSVSDSEFGLLGGVSTEQLVKSPLFKALAGDSP